MHKILEPNNLIMRILGTQSNDIRKYRISYYCEIINFNEHWVIYNNFTREMVVLSSTEYDKVKKGDLNEDFVAYLFENWFLIPINFNEKTLVDNTFNVYKMFVNDGSITKFTIMTTLDCNARCYYCYEHGREKTYMLNDTAIATAKFIHKHCNGRKVFLNWFGGEPLLNLEVIDIICQYLRENDIDFQSDIVSNGYLFSDKTINRFVKDYNLNSVQITLDGCKDIYNKVKAYIYEDINPFNTVLNNIKKLLSNDIKVEIRLNYGNYNSDDLKKLVVILKDKFGNNQLLTIYSHLLYEYSKETDLLDKDTIMPAYKEFQQFLLNMFPKVKISRSLRVNACMADDDKSVVITPQGTLTKCEHFSDSEIFGTIYDDKYDDLIIKSWKEYVIMGKRCNSCTFYPNCFHLKKCPNKFNCSNEYIELRRQNLRASIEMIYREYINTDRRFS